MARAEAPAGRVRPALARPSFGVGDVVAGVSVALVLIPQALAYAQLAGMPPHTGLYAAALAPIAAAFFASSPYLQTGPVALTALLTFGGLAALATPETDEYVALAALLALVVGAVRVAVGLLRAGVIAYLMSQAVLIGFMPAAAILIVASQLPTALGAGDQEGGVLRGAWNALTNPGSWGSSAILLAALSIVLVLAGRRLHAFFPGVLVAVLVGIGWSELGGYDGATVGDVPSGLPPLSVDLPWSDLLSLLVPGIVIALVGFAEPASIARTFAAAERRPWDPNREFVSQGAANVASAFSGGFPVGGSFSRSSLARLTGARTRWTGAITGLVVLAFLPFAGVLSPLPTAVLAAIVIGAVAGLIRIGPMLEVVRYSRPQTAIMLTTFVLTLALSPHVEQALLAGIGLAVGIHLWRELRLDVETAAEGTRLHVRPKGVLWFASARALEDKFVSALAEHPGAEALVIHLDGLGRIDLTGALALKALLDDARAAGLDLEVEGPPPHALPLLRRVFPEHVT